jgi:hypothetical protein
MNASELRIGNWANIIGIDCQVESIDPPYVNKTEDFKPIPLSEEWLLKSGFVKGSHFDGVIYKTEQLTVIYTDSNFYKLDQEHYHTEGIPLKYLHQLQNLYFTLSGEEINLSEKVNGNQGTE